MSKRISSLTEKSQADLTDLIEVSSVDGNSSTGYTSKKESLSTVANLVASKIIKYSTTEQIVGKWIDDSDIYQKTIYFGNLPNSGLAQIAHNITNIGRAIEIGGIGYNSTTNLSIPIPYVNTSVENQLACYIDGTYLYVNTAGNLSQYEAYITIKYLKSV